MKLQKIVSRSKIIVEKKFKKFWNWFYNVFQKKNWKKKSKIFEKILKKKFFAKTFFSYFFEKIRVIVITELFLFFLYDKIWLRYEFLKFWEIYNGVPRDVLCLGNIKKN